jgi:hypothetical protein
MEKKVIEIEVKDNSKNLKQQYKEAVLEVQKLADAFGATSIEVQNASKRAAELKDQIEDVNDAIQAQKGEGAFIALGKSISTVASGFSAVEGAMGLVGAESEDVQKAMLRVQSAMALAQGLEGLEDAGRAFKQLGVVIKGTTVFQTAYNFVVYGTISATKAQTIATDIQTGSTVAASTATKALRIAMLALPIVAVVAGILALANAMGAFGDATETAEEKQAKLDKQLEKTNKKIERQKELNDEFAELLSDIQRQELIDAKKRGASEKEINKIQDEQAKHRLKNLKEQYDEAAKYQLKISKTFTDSRQLDAAEKASSEAWRRYSDLRLEIEEKEADRIYQRRIDNAKKTNEELFIIDDSELKRREAQRKMDAENLEKYLGDMSMAEIKSAKEGIQLLATTRTAELEIEKNTADKKRQLDEDEIARKKQLRNVQLQLTADAFGAIGQLIESFNAKDEATARKQFKVAKAFNLSSALVNTALAVTSALAMRPDQQVFPGQRFVEAGIAGATGLASVVKIASTQFGGGGGGGGVDVPNPSSIIAPNLNVVGNTGINQLATLQQQPVKAYVVSNDITSAQQFDLKVQQTSQL